MGFGANGPNRRRLCFHVNEIESEMTPDAGPLVVMTALHSFASGGVERVALRLNAAFRRDASLRPVIVMGRETGEMRAEAPAGVERRVTASAISTAAWESLWMMLVLPRHIRATAPDVLFAAGNSYAVIVAAMKLWLRRRCPPIVLKISNDLVRADMHPVVRWGYHRWLRIQGRIVDHATGLAEPMRAEIAQFLRLPADRIHIIDDPALTAADHAALVAIGAARQPPGRSRHYVGIGRLARQKNWPLVVTGFARVAGPDDRLTIVGEGGERGRILATASALGVVDRLALPGHGEAFPALAAADVFVLGSDFEGVPAVVIEALASGLPVVATDCSVSMAGLIGGFGTVVPVGDRKTFGETFGAAFGAAMAAQTPLSAEQRTAAAAAMACFTVERAARAYAAVFRRAASAPD